MSYSSASCGSNVAFVSKYIKNKQQSNAYYRFRNPYSQHCLHSSNSRLVSPVLRSSVNLSHLATFPSSIFHPIYSHIKTFPRSVFSAISDLYTAHYSCLLTTFALTSCIIYDRSRKCSQINIFMT